MVKVLLSGNVNGEWEKVIARAGKLHASKHGPFDALICIGKNSSGPDPQLEFPLPTFGCIECSSPLAKHFTLLQPNDIVKIRGLHVACCFEEHLLESFERVVQRYPHAIDLFCTNQYPQGFLGDVDPTSLPTNAQIKVESQVNMSSFLLNMAPRYHLLSSVDHPFFYARPPYLNHNQRITRVIGLAPVNSLDQKWLHALNLVLLPEEEKQKLSPPAGTTVNPYLVVPALPSSTGAASRKTSKNLSSATIQKLQESVVATPPSFRYDNDHHHHQRHKKPKLHTKDRRACWFCLATPELEKHLIISIGQEVYLALPKGGLVPEHVLIIPIAHDQSMVEITSKSAREEIESIQRALSSYFASLGQTVFFFERKIITEGTSHAHYECIPISENPSLSLSELIQTEGAKTNMTFTSFSTFSALQTSLLSLSGQVQYFYAEIRHGADNSETTYLLSILEGRTYLFFGRHIAALVYAQPDRKDWKFCITSTSEEMNLATRFKGHFKPFDPLC